MKKGNILAVAFGLCLFFFFLSIFPKEPSQLSKEQIAFVEKTLSILSPEEKKNLEELFEHFFFFEQFSYPLFGTKPMSIARLLPTNKAKIGWSAWKKIAPYLQSENYVIREYVYNDSCFVLIANIREVENIFNENIGVFTESFDGRMTLESLKYCLRNETPLFQELMQNDVCLGILLGYGRRNAELYSHNQEKPDSEKFPLRAFSSWHPIFYYFSSVMPVYFGCDFDSDETAALLVRYQAERNKIRKIASTDGLFIRMLTLLKD